MSKENWLEKKKHPLKGKTIALSGGSHEECCNKERLAVCKETLENAKHNNNKQTMSNQAARLALSAFFRLFLAFEDVRVGSGWQRVCYHNKQRCTITLGALAKSILK